MKPRDLSYDELMDLCGHDDGKVFVGICRKNGFHIPRGKPVPFETAAQIYRTLQHKNLDPLPYKLQARDEREGGPLQWQTDDVDAELVAGWYEKLSGVPGWPAIEADGPSLLGFVSEGGFLGRDRSEPFVLRVVPGVNILIGERGAGKSTALSLLGLLAPRRAHDANVLLTRVMSGLLSDEDDALTDNGRAVGQLLRSYDIERYACFYRHGGRTFAYTVEMGPATRGLFVLDRQTWSLVPEDAAQPIPNMLVLVQGEVFKIADEANPYYLNVLVDALFPDLREQRDKYLRRVKKLAAQYEAFGKQPERPASHGRMIFERFMDQRDDEIGQLKGAVRRRRWRPEDATILQRWKEKLEVEPPGVRGLSLSELLRKDDVDTLWFVLFARANRFMRRDISNVLEGLSGVLAAFSRDDPAEKDKDGVDEISIDWILERDDDETDDTIEYADSWELLGYVAQVLYGRVRALRAACDRFAKLPLFTDAAAGLARSLIELLQLHADLIDKQQSCCLEVQRVLDQGVLNHRVHTRNAADTREEDGRIWRTLKLLPEHYVKVVACNAWTAYADVDAALKIYLNIFSALIRRCKDIWERAKDPEMATFFDPIEIELKQGSDFMRFEKLSFGQRSGIILNMVLGTTTHEVIVLDQPEDNLDAYAVAELALTLRKLGEKRQIIVATHNSSIVMGISEAKLHVLASEGGAGALWEQGKLTDQNVTRAVLDVLEGGVEPFRYKMQTYADFLQTLQGEIDSMELADIESTFRRRTIDGLRNFLQPVVSNVSMLQIARHELRQTLASADISAARSEIARWQTNDGAAGELLTKVDKVLTNIDAHIERVQAKIADLQMFDTHPHQEMVDVGELLADLAVPSGRDIDVIVDSNLRGLRVFFDRKHLRLVFDNLFNNAYRATELRAVDALKRRQNGCRECIEAMLWQLDENWARIYFADNGRGIPIDIRERLYVSRCSDQDGQQHGVGAVIIRKMLSLNGGEIRVLASHDMQGTLQEIRLRRRPRYEEETVARGRRPDHRGRVNPG